MPGNKGDSSFFPFLISRLLSVRIFARISFSFSSDRTIAMRCITLLARHRRDAVAYYEG